MSERNFPKSRQRLNLLMKKLSKELAGPVSGFAQLRRESLADGALSRKSKELIAFGVAIAARCDACIAYHVHDALRAGGSNDLTQLVLGLDRDSGTVAHLFDERNEAVRQMIARAIEAAHGAGKPIGICGQAPSDYPDLAAWPVRQGINSISLNPDTAVKTAFVIAEEDAAQARAAAP